MDDLTENQFTVGADHYRAGRLDAAVRSWREALGRAPGDLRILWNLGIVLRDLAAWSDAAAVWRAFLALAPDDAKAQRYLAFALHGQGRLEDAVPVYRRTLVIGEGAGALGDVRWNLAVALKALRRWADCAVVWREIAGERLSDPVSRNELGLALRVLGRQSEAEAACRQAVTLDPAQPGAWLTLGGVRRAFGDLDGSIAIHRRLLTARPDLPEARKRLDEALECRDALSKAAATLGGGGEDRVAAMLAPVAVRFDEAIGVGGNSPRGVLHHDPDLHRLSFERLTAVFGPEVADGGVSVNDLGCGYGALFDFLKDAPALVGGRYFGYDISAEMVEAARAAIGDPRAYFLHSHRATETADYSIVAGAYNLCLAADADAWLDLVKESLRSLAAMTRRGLAFNMLSHHVPQKSPGLFYADPAAMVDFCLREIGSGVVLLHDYSPLEWIIHVKAPFRRIDAREGNVA